jgi:hypothetical protein
MAPSNVLAVEEMVNGFTNPFLPKIDNEPTFEDIQVTTRMLNENSISVSSMTGRGAHGHMATLESSGPRLSMLPSHHLRGWILTIITPFHLSQQAPMPWMQLNLYACMLSSAVSTTNRINVDQALKRIILEAYDNMYTSQLED